jgi:hypothetical protein
MLVGFIALALLMVVESSAGGTKGAANKYTTFNFYGPIDYYDYISGTITIDTVHGTVASVNLQVWDDFWGELAVFDSGATVSTNAVGDVEITADADYRYSTDYPSQIVLTLPVPSLKKYAGGDIIASDSYWWNGSQTYYLENGDLVSQ